MLKKYPCPKKPKHKIFGSKRVRSKKVVVQTNVIKKIEVQKNFGSKKILGSKNLDTKMFGSKIWL